MAKLVVQLVNAIARHCLVSEFLAGIEVINTQKLLFSPISRDQNFLLLSSKLTLRRKNTQNRTDAIILTLLGCSYKKEKKALSPLNKALN